MIPVRLAIAYHQTPQPQAFLILGGDIARSKTAAEVARFYPSLQIWVSSPADARKTIQAFRDAGIPDSRVNIDYRAVDTVTNFSTIVPQLQQRNIQHLYLVTSDFHMRRSQAIAFIILGSQGIAFTPISVASNRPQDSIDRVLRDIIRSILWVFTGWTGVNLPN
ncbi:YdcF family protein [Anabaena sp. CA = ATCC 33047]|uniref:YdcF family protein n=1 Tax=Anabaena sp. (strain CA / ATCC 33047) TaxID=52271 RepID=UPI001E3052B5|nr:YdcF family protein [Anabaena sp. CA = ATCC 33047]